MENSIPAPEGWDLSKTEEIGIAMKTFATGNGLNMNALARKQVLATLGKVL